MKGKNILFAYGIWVGLLILALLVANQLYVAAVFFTTSAIETGNYYTWGWNIHTVSAFARFFIFLLGIAWLFWLGITEHLLVQARSPRIMWLWAGRLLGVLIAIFLLATLSLFVLR